MTDPGGAHRGSAAADPAQRERFARAKRIFFESIELPQVERDRAVAEACEGDEALLREVTSLLESDGRDGSFLEQPALGWLASGSADPGAVPGPQLQPGIALGGYVVETLLGTGGMGEVYLARDTRLGRLVAIKIVSGVRSGERAEAALLREARHASVLSHPCICAVHEVGESDGRRFIVMEHVEGVTLRALVARRGRLPLAEVLQQGGRIAGALEHAHARGVVHRDLKSANVMVSSEGATKVLDFGLARWLPDAAARQATASFDTETLALAGTLDYMAPEVLLGGPADARSDIWSLGVLLYEMASGTPPFRRATAVETASAILRADPPPSSAGPSLGLRLVIGRCLAREPESRYQRAGEVREALHALEGGWRERRRIVAGLAWGAARRRLLATAGIALAAVALVGAGAWLVSSTQAVPPRTMRTLLVTPLVDSAGAAGKEQAYFVDGLTEALIGGIGETGVQRVISRTTAVMARQGARAPLDVARQFRADGILEGTVARSGGRVRLSVRLLNVADSREVWATSQERADTEVAALVANVASAVAAGMNHATTEDAAMRLATVRAVRPDVYEAYLQGRYEWNQRTAPSLRRAIAHYQDAIRLDPSYARAHAALADCYNQLGTVMVGTGSPAQYRPLAAASAIKALQIDNNLSEAHATLAYVRHYDWQWKESEREFQEAIRLNPSNALAHVWYANLLASLRRMPEALREVERGGELDPLSLVVNTNVGWTLGYAGRHDEAIKRYRDVLRMDPGYVQAYLRLGGALEATGRFQEAMAAFQQAAKLTGNANPSQTALAGLYASMGSREHAFALLDVILREARRGYVSPSSIAGVYEKLGRNDAAFAWLEEAYAERSNSLAYLGADPHNGLRADPRFTAMLRRVGLE